MHPILDKPSDQLIACPVFYDKNTRQCRRFDSWAEAHYLLEG
jgi:hypothetical protein